MTIALTGRGRPLRFLALVVVGWIGLRIAILWPQKGSLPEAIKAVLAPEVEADVEVLPTRAQATETVRPRIVTVRREAVPVSAPRLFNPPPPMTAVVQVRLVEPLYIAASPDFAVPVQNREPTPSRWSGSAWLMVRQGSGVSAAPGGQIGGSQGGVRIAYAIDLRGRIAVFGRAVTPLSGSGREGAIGVEWQPTAAPIRLVAEHRIAVDSGRSGPGLGVVAGGGMRLPAGFRLETYGQAGAIRRERVEPYADGAMRATRVIPGTRLSLGAGAWGAAQRGATRVDVGPSATLAMPVGGQQIRVALDWRQRVAGDARPGSGVALTLGSDF